jgi:hypothetical protein
MSRDFFDISAVDKSLRLFRLVLLVAWCPTLDDRHDQNLKRTRELKDLFSYSYGVVRCFILNFPTDSIRSRSATRVAPRRSKCDFSSAEISIVDM